MRSTTPPVHCAPFRSEAFFEDLEDLEQAPVPLPLDFRLFSLAATLIAGAWLLTACVTA